MLWRLEVASPAVKSTCCNQRVPGGCRWRQKCPLTNTGSSVVNAYSVVSQRYLLSSPACLVPLWTLHYAWPVLLQIPAASCSNDFIASPRCSHSSSPSLELCYNPQYLNRLSTFLSNCTIISTRCSNSTTCEQTQLRQTNASYPAFSVMRCVQPPTLYEPMSPL